MRGYEKVSDAELYDLYGDPPTFKNLKWPETNTSVEKEQGSHWTMMSLDESYKVGIVLHVYDLILREVIEGKTFM